VKPGVREPQQHGEVTVVVFRMFGFLCTVITAEDPNDAKCEYFGFGTSNPPCQAHHGPNLKKAELGRNLTSTDAKHFQGPFQLLWISVFRDTAWRHVASRFASSFLLFDAPRPLRTVAEYPFDCCLTDVAPPSSFPPTPEAWLPHGSVGPFPTKVPSPYFLVPGSSPLGDESLSSLSHLVYSGPGRFGLRLLCSFSRTSAFFSH